MRRVHIPLPQQHVSDTTLPLINIVFLLLIFVMLTGVIRSSDPLAIAPPQSATSSLSKPIMEHTLYMDMAGQLAWRDKRKKTALEDFISAYHAESWEKAWLKADKQTQAAQVMQVMDKLRLGGLDNITIIMEQRR